MTLTLIETANTFLSQGKMVGVPTDTVYGLAVDATNQSALNAISQFKGRPPSKPYVIQVGSLDKVFELIDSNHQKDASLLESYWPGEITFIFKTSKNINLPTIGETIAIRIPENEFLLKLLNHCSFPLAITSLNKSGAPPMTDFQSIPSYYHKEIPLIIPSKEKNSTVSSTIVSLITTPPTLLRQGALTFEV
jgi:L-threonylcarbamoyladenylate synthase